MGLTAGYDAELQRYDDVLREAVGIEPDDHVLDIGCGAGQTTRHAATTARAGSAVGVDISVAAIERARALARAAGLRNVTFEQADAQVHPFPPAGFDRVISRFGTMFFDDPAAAFANLGRALRPAGRLVMMVWQAREHNEWDVAIRRSLGAAAAPGEPDPFSLADPPTVRAILEAAGFANVAFTDVHAPVFYGPDVAAALEWVRGFTCARAALTRLGPAAGDDRLRQLLASHLTADGVWFDSRAWIVAAERVRSQRSAT